MYNKDKFKTRFDVYYPMLCRIAFGYIPDTHECEDIVQECFIAVWHNGKHELDEKEFLAYMVRAVKNNCISFLRKQNINMVSLDDNQSPIASSEIIDEENGNVSADEKLNKILSVLPPKCKEIFLLSKLHGLKYQEIATKQDISVKTVENQMGKALKLIREQLKTGFFTIVFIFLLSLLK